MRHIIRTYKRLALISFLIFCMVWNFVFGLEFSAFVDLAKAAAFTSTQTGNWNVGTTWGGACAAACVEGVDYPGASDTATIVNAAADIVVTVPTGVSANFSTLTVGGDAAFTSELILQGNIAAGGSITIATKGILTQKNTTTQTITGTLLIESGGTLTHTQNTTTHDYEVDFSAATITLNTGGFVSTTGRGYSGGTFTNPGSGLGGGTYNSGADGGASSDAGGGGAYGGNGGNHLDNRGGGAGYCDVSSVSSLGSGGGGGGNATGGSGGGLIRLQASGTATLSGTVGALGGTGGEDGVRDAGGGSGGGIYISANTVAGVPDNFTVQGGSSGNGNSGGGGGGGCISIAYTNTNTITTADTRSGTGFQHGGAGKLFTKKTNQNGTLFLNNNGSATAAYTPQAAASLTLDALAVSNGSTYTVTTTQTLVVRDASPFSAGDGAGSVFISNGATFTPTSTANFTIANATLQLTRNATLSNSTTLDIYVGNSGTLDLRDFTTTSPLQLDTLTVQNGGTLTHGTNSDAQSHVVFVSSTAIDIQAGGTINVTGKGYAGGTAGQAGKGPGAGVYATAEAGSGAGHAGAGGADVNGDAGGSAYCSASSPGTIGSGGGGGADATGGRGGGFIGLRSSGALTVAGSLVASGNAGGAGGADVRDAGGGAGGGINLYGAGLITISGSVTVNGGASGDNGANGTYRGGGGGGGCTYILYGTLNNTGSHSEGGGAGSVAGSNGSFSTAALNVAPSVTAITPQVARNGEGMVTVTTTVTDAEGSTITLHVDFSVDGGGSWAAATMSSATAASGTPGLAAGQVTNIVSTTGAGNAVTFIWSSFDDSVTSTQQAKLRIRPNDGSVFGTTVSSSNFTVDNVAPSTPGDLTVVSSSTTSIVFGFGTTSSDPNFLDYRIFYSPGPQVNFATATAFTSTTDANLASSTYAGATTTTVTGLSANTLYAFLLAAYDSYGNSTTTVGSISGYTLASVPSSLSAVQSGSSLQVSWSGNGTAYYVQNTTAGTNSGWTSASSYSFQNALCGTTYTITVKARNGNGIETATVSTSVSTTACSSPAPAVVAPPPPPPSEPPAEPVVTEPPAEPEEPVVEKTEPPKEEIKEPPKPKPEAEKPAEAKPKTEQPPAQQSEPASASQNSPAGGESSSVSPGTVTVTEEHIKDASIIVVKSGKLLAVTNDRSIDLALDTGYARVTIEDTSGTVLERAAVASVIPWTLRGTDGQKCITATFYDESGQAAKQKVTCVGLDTTPPPAPKVKNVGTSLAFEKKVQGKKVSVKGVAEPGAAVLISVHRTANIGRSFVLSVYAATQGDFVTTADEHGNWSYTLPEVFEKGIYEIRIRAKDVAGNVSEQVSTSVTITLEKTEIAVEKTVEAVKEVIDNPKVEHVNEVYVAPAIVGVGVANVAAGTQLPQIFVYLRYLFAQPILLLRRRKYKTWGTIYNAFTKQPVDLATVRLVHHEKGTVVRSQVTDTQGRYFLFADPGVYRIEIDKSGYSGISQYLKGKDEDGAYLRIYHGDAMNVDEDHTEINYSVPMDPIDEQKPASTLIRERVVKGVQHIISLSGLGVTVFSFIISPNPKIAIFFFAHLLMYALSYKFTHVSLPGSFGVVKSEENKKGIYNVVVRVFDAAYNKLVTTTLTDRKGRYAALVGPSTYYVVYEKPGFETKKSTTLDFSSQKTNGMGGMIALDEELPMQKESGSSGSASAATYHVMPDLDAKKDEDAAADDVIAQWKDTH